MMQSDEMLRRVAPVLSSLRWRIVFLGGATTHLFITDAGAPKPSTTTDVDVVVDTRSRVTYQVDLHDALRRLGAKEDTSEGAPLCRWILDTVAVDIMPVDPAILGFSNPWYEEAVRHAQRVVLSEGLEILLVTAPHFLATKIEAFRSRGEGDFLSSKDIEDIVAVVDGRSELVHEVRSASEKLRSYLSEAVTAWLEHRDFAYAVEGYLQDDERYEIVMRRFEELARL